MNSYRKHMLVAAATLLVALGAAPAAADVKAGVDSWQAGNYAAAVKEWRPLAEKGDADAQFNMAQAYKLGRGVEPDLKIAQSWYEKAAAQGHEQAQGNLGLILFQNGERTAAIPWIKKAADRGDPRAQYVLGTALFNGDLAGKDWPRAYALMTRAAASGLPQAATSLAEMDRYVPLAERQQGLVLAKQMEGGAVALAANTATPRADTAMAAPMQVKPTASAAVTEAPRPVAKPAPVVKPVPAAKPVVAAAKPAAPTAKPAAPAVKPAMISASGRWKVQFGAYGDPGNARRQWDLVSKKVAALAGLQPMMVKAGAVTRLQAGPFADRATADRICASAKAAGQACFATAQ